MTATPAWMDEIDLDPTVSWRRMATRSLGADPWLVLDDRASSELALRRSLLRDHRDEVVVAPDHSLPAATELVALAVDEGWDVTGPADDPLGSWAASLQEDVCLLRRADDGWHLDAGVLCFGSRWRLADRVGKELGAVHGPVPGYAEQLASRTTTLLDRLGPRIVRRRNWFVHPDGSLHQPDRPVDGDPVLRGEERWSGLFLRSERQTLRLLPSTGWVAFTIRIQQAPLGAFLADPSREAAFFHYLRAVPDEEATHRGLSPEQVRQLLVDA